MDEYLGRNLPLALSSKADTRRRTPTNTSGTSKGFRANLKNRSCLTGLLGNGTSRTVVLKSNDEKNRYEISNI